MMNNRAKSTLAACLMVSGLAVATVPTAAALPVSEQSESMQAKQQLQQRLAEIDTLSANFTQLVSDADGEVVQQLNGVLSLARPHYLRWQTDAPDETLMIADGEAVWYYNPFVEQVTVYPQQDAVEQSPLLILLDANTERWQQYQVERSETGFVITATEQQQQQLALSFDSQQRLSRLQVTDAQGQVTDIKLASVVINQPIAAEQFQFSVPEGVAIDDQRPQ
ncbi:outer membrane lipoprotein chaperone LolA [Idiomarina xiamenensis]|uniref:Outer-membrane lipoprotein carrier protein n=1 Tax=Idiomarina xiamenensis 10-D-4 TaxID=740709 RepID=K2KQR0_9GAMM|nr:outer membrane lipoprotein chaperone LolA [Idiomarina xiamenensis]EKE79845.1 outer membrane lipoprotein carrier protein LolA [Idiomarina xiamenensis 10-D-4]